MTPHQPNRNLLDELAADAPMDRMRARVDALATKVQAAEAPTLEALESETLKNADLRQQKPRSFRTRWPIAAILALAMLGLARWLSFQPASPSGTDPPLAQAEPSHATTQGLNAASALDRLAAVYRAADRIEDWRTLESFLIERLSNDASVNVRLAALDVLLEHIDVANRFAELTEALERQDADIVRAHFGYRLGIQLPPGRLTELLTEPALHPAARSALEMKEVS
ncbi:MAG: hypothetical protein AAF560_21860 [Acidobacteriota bacterium]